MPDISNEDLMKLIYRVLKKVDQIEEKLDRVLGKTQKTPENQQEATRQENTKFDCSFNFKPIQNTQELDVVTFKIKNDKDYKAQLQTYFQVRGHVKLEDIFSGEFLCDQTQSSLEKLAPYDAVYVYLKAEEDGLTKEDLRKLVAKELHSIKHKIRMRQFRKKQRSKRNSLNEEQQFGVFEDDVENYDETSLSESMKQEFVTLGYTNDDDVDAEEANCDVEPGEIPSTSVKQETSFENIDEAVAYYDDEENFIFNPISNDDELNMVSNKILTNPDYLTNLRVHIVEDSKDGICSLEQLFTEEFLNETNMVGMFQKKRLPDLVPYKTVYYYLKKHLGLSFDQIEKDASDELKRIKSRLSTRLSRLKQKSGT